MVHGHILKENSKDMPHINTRATHAPFQVQKLHLILYNTSCDSSEQKNVFFMRKKTIMNEKCHGKKLPEENSIIKERKIN